MLSPSLRKSVAELSRRKARSAFTVATLALAVASVSFFAIPTVIDRAMEEQVRAQQLAHVAVSMRPLELTEGQLDELAALPNVAEVEPRSSVDTRVLLGDRRAPARIIGIRDFDRQWVDLVLVESGAAPHENEVLTDVQNANVGVYDGGAGDALAVLSGPGGAGDLQLNVSGEGRSLPGGEDVQDENVIVLYADLETVARLSGEAGYGRLAFRLHHPSSGAAEKVVEEIRSYLRTVPGFTGFANLPEVRAPDDWPGKADTQTFADLLSVITVLAMLSAVVLISNTMTTLIAEQTGEIGIMRAVGARRRQVALVYLRTALILGLLGAAVGSVLGVLLVNMLARYFGSLFWAVDVPFAVDWTVLVAGVCVGLVGPPLASVPAVRRATRTDLREALESTGSAVGSQDAGDRLLRRIRFVPRPVQIGLRGLGRRKRRSLATVVIVALAVGNLLAVLGLAGAVTKLTEAEWGDHLEDVRIWTTGREAFDPRAEKAILATPGVAEAQPALVNDVLLGGNEAFVWGVPREPLVRYRLSDGRWFSAGEEQARERVAVIEGNLAEATGTTVGDVVALQTAAGPTDVRIVGIAKNQQEDGTVLFVPLTTLRELVGAPTGATTYWIRTESAEHAFVDRTTARLEDRLAALGYEIATEITYVGTRENVAENRTITTTIALLGFMIVAISMVALANAMTTNVLERTREIGILRCIGARARDVRRIFASEGVALAVAGWLLGIPVGYALNRLLVWLIWEVVDVRVPASFPTKNVLLALVGTVLLSLLITLLPVRRAVRLRAGDALRYA